MSSFTQGLPSFSSSWMHFFFFFGRSWGLALLRMWEGDSFHCAIVTLRCWRTFLCSFQSAASASSLTFTVSRRPYLSLHPPCLKKTSTFSLDFGFTVPGLASTSDCPTSQIHNRWLSQRSLFLIVWLGLILGYVLVSWYRIRTGGTFLGLRGLSAFISP